MKKRFIWKFCLSALVVLLVLLSAAPLQTGRDNGGSSWMSELEDARRINTLLIPGTHDSGALYSIADVAGKCQSLTIKDQLDCGVRFLDIRLKLTKDKLNVVHSFVDQKQSFDDVLSDITGFIEKNPSEFLLVSIKEDADANEPLGSFAEILEAKLSEHSNLISKSNILPETVGEARGKIFIISRYENSTLGIPAYDGWLDSTSFALGSLYVQDNYALESEAEKIADIDSCFAESETGEHALVLNFTSCYLTHGFPPSYAATPAHKINKDLCEKLCGDDALTGVLVCDFMTSDLAKSIWEVSFR